MATRPRPAAFARLFARRRLDGSKNAALRRKLAAALHVSANAITISATETAVGEHTGATVVFTIRLEGRRRAIAARRKITRQYGSKAKAAALLGATLASVDAPTRAANYPPPPPAPPPPNTSPHPPSPPPPRARPRDRRRLRHRPPRAAADEATATETHGHISGGHVARRRLRELFAGKGTFNAATGAAAKRGDKDPVHSRFRYPQAGRRRMDRGRGDSNRDTRATYRGLGHVARHDMSELFTA